MLKGSSVATGPSAPRRLARQRLLHPSPLEGSSPSQRRGLHSPLEALEEETGELVSPRGEMTVSPREKSQATKGRRPRPATRTELLKPRKPGPPLGLLPVKRRARRSHLADRGGRPSRTTQPKGQPRRDRRQGQEGPQMRQMQGADEPPGRVLVGLQA